MKNWANLIKIYSLVQSGLFSIFAFPKGGTCEIGNFTLIKKAG
jgi:hypothetical protein